jgi:hypothetical protein
LRSRLFRRSIEIAMLFKRTCAGLIVGLLLLVSSAGAACDLSCAFAGAGSDCHSLESQRQSKTDSPMAMDGGDMAGMSMPGEMNNEARPAVSEISQTRPAHPSLGEMGLCERQSCVAPTTISAKSNRSTTSQFRLALSIAPLPSANVSLPAFHDARDDVAQPRSDCGRPRPISLRI